MGPICHADEIEVQTRANVREVARRVGNGIHATLPWRAAEFLAGQPRVIVGSTDPDAHVGLRSGGRTRLRARRRRADGAPRRHPGPGDPLAATLIAAEDPTVRPELSVLVIDLETRDRMRINGSAEVRRDGKLLVSVREAYFNCPKYTQSREVSVADAAGAAGVMRSEVLSPQQRAWVGAADTFFVASAAPGGGADASHRGGNPGFVRVRDAATREWPDYSGNMMFNTLGNITASPGAGLLFLDFDRGDTLQMTGRATVVWEPERGAAFPGAERAVEFHVERAVQTATAVRLRFHFRQYSRFNPA